MEVFLMSTAIALLSETLKLFTMKGWGEAGSTVVLGLNSVK
ncbi:MAG: hypothetical protein WBG32_19850 [Nodosilinea sp.]